MNRRLRMIALPVAVGVALIAAAPANASFHLMKVRAIFLGPTDGAFVELQMTASGQNFVHGQTIDVYPNTGSLHSAFVIPSDVANGGNQHTILLGDTSAAGSPDFTLAGLRSSLSNVASAGALCYSGIDCVSWGSFTNNAVLPSPAGTPMSGLSPSQVAIRGISRGCPTALDDPDDTNNSVADFTFGTFTPTNNAATPAEVPCPTTTPHKKKKCKKKKHRSAESAKKKKCKKKKKG
jgi:hypothetical protein